MSIKRSIIFSSLFFLTYALQVHAASLINLEVEVSKNDKTSKNKNVITLDGKKVRVDYLGSEPEKTETTPYLLTLNAGKSWIIGNQDEGEFYCAKVDMKDLFRDLGDIISRIDSFTNAKFTDDKVEVILQETGPEILGYATTHVRIKTTANIKASILVKRFKFNLNKIDDVWYAKGHAIHPAKKRWIEALTHSGYENLDKLSSNVRENINGSILKQESVMKITNLKKNVVDTYARKLRVVSIQELDSSAVAKGTFVKPKCKKIKKSQTKGVAKSMFKEGKLAL